MSTIARRGSHSGSLANLLMDSEASLPSLARKNSSFTVIFSSAFLDMYSLAKGSSTFFALSIELLDTNQTREAVSLISSVRNSVNVLTYQGKFYDTYNMSININLYSTSPLLPSILLSFPLHSFIAALWT